MVNVVKEIWVDNRILRIEEVAYWIGWDNSWEKQRAEMLDCLTKVANGEYLPKDLKEDILSLAGDLEEVT